MKKTFNTELIRLNINKEDIYYFYYNIYKLAMNLIFLPFEVVPLILAFVPFERTDGIYNLQRELTLTFIIIFGIEIMKKIFIPPIGTMVGGIMVTSIEKQYNPDNERLILTLEKIAKKKEKRRNKKSIINKQ